MVSLSTRICLSWLRTRLAIPPFDISIIFWDPSDPLRRPSSAEQFSEMMMCFDRADNWACSPFLQYALAVMLQINKFQTRHFHQVHPPPPPSSLWLLMQECQSVANIWPHLHVLYLDTGRSLASHHLNFLSALGGTRPPQAALSFPPYGTVTVFSSLISL